MAEKTLNTRILLKYDTYTNWTTKNPVLKAGELAIATIPSDDQQNTQTVNSVTKPQILIKVGDGSSHYNDLKFVSGLAADVHTWAKAATKPSYSASEISGLSDFISGQIQDTDTQYQIVKGNTNNDTKIATYKLQSKAKSASEWADVSTFDLHTNDSINILIATAINNLNLASDYETKGAAKAVQDDLDAYKSSNDTAVATAQSTANDAKNKIDTFMAAADVTQDAVDTLKEIQDYITSDGKTAATMTANIAANTKAISDEVTRATEAEQELSGNIGQVNTLAESNTGRITELESTSHTHGNMSALNSITSYNTSKWSSAIQTITPNTGLTADKSGTTVTIGFDDSTTFIFNCGNATI